ncbi:glutaredoxin family protein [Ornithinimicrobium panacihumi]|uniref:glutaredoxin family protein n=1 Tax=Ornithinimicrobium panacihumi TaxID=2008449 RepID=UPI003F889166
MPVRLLIALTLAWVALLMGAPAPAAATSQSTSQTAPDETIVIEYYYGEECPVCAITGPVLDQLAEEIPGVQVVEREVWHDEAARAVLEQRAEAYNVDVTGVPVIFVGERAWVGFREGVTEAAPA